MNVVVFLAGAMAVVGAWVALVEAHNAVLAGQARRRLAPNVRRPALGARLAVMASRLRRDREAVDRGLPVWLDGAARSARGGASLRDALRDGASIVRESPVGQSLEPFVEAIDRGDRLEHAFDHLGPPQPGTPREVVVRALRLASAVGGPSADVLGAAASTLHERAALAREVRALSTQARASAMVMAAAPLVFAVGAVQLDPRVGAFLASAPGVACVAVGVALDVAGAVWMARIVRAGA